MQDGLISAKEKLLTEHKNINSEWEHEEFHKTSVVYLLNNDILRNNSTTFQWKLRLESNPNGTGRILGIISFENSKISKK